MHIWEALQLVFVSVFLSALEPNNFFVSYKKNENGFKVSYDYKL